MWKVYKRIKNVLHYHEAWVNGPWVAEHWGKVGERGKTVQHRKNRKLTNDQNVEQIVAKAVKQGFKPIDDDDHSVLLIQYAISGMGTGKDLDKRHALENRMNETLGWTGLGYCDGGSIGSGTMDVCCFVVDFKIAQRVVEKDLKKTEFADYSRIYDERAEPPAEETESESAGPTMLVPPWFMHQEIERDDAGWQRGEPAEFLARWTTWFRSFPADAQAAYVVAFREPPGWKGFYESLSKPEKKSVKKPAKPAKPAASRRKGRRKA
jgi:hypothetical protein